MEHVLDPRRLGVGGVADCSAFAFASLSATESRRFYLLNASSRCVGSTARLQTRMESECSYVQPVNLESDRAAGVGGDIEVTTSSSSFLLRSVFAEF